MTRDDGDQDATIDLAVYGCLVVLTAVTAASAAWLGLGRIVAVALALGIAAFKAVLIGLYYMHLRREGPLIHAIIWVGIAAVAILAIGILPDAALRL